MKDKIRWVKLSKRLDSRRERDAVPNLVFLHEPIVQLANVLDCTKINEEPFYWRKKLIELTPVKEKIRCVELVQVAQKI